MPPTDSIKPSTSTCYEVEQSKNRLTVRFQSDTQHLRPLRLEIEEFARECGFDDKGWAEIGLVVNEAVANVIRHAYHPGVHMPVELTAQRTTDGIVIDLRDWGHGQMPIYKPASNGGIRNEIPEPGGLGLICMKTLMDDVSFSPQNPGMLLHMSRSIRR